MTTSECGALFQNSYHYPEAFNKLSIAIFQSKTGGRRFRRITSNLFEMMAIKVCTRAITSLIFIIPSSDSFLRCSIV